MKTLLVLVSLFVISFAGCNACDIEPEEEPGYRVRTEQPASPAADQNQQQEQKLG